MRKPYFNAQKKSWWVRFNGKQVRLGKTREEAEAAWHLLMATGETPAKIQGTTVGFIIGEFLTWTKAHREPTSYNWYRGYLAGSADRPNHAFGQCFGDRPITDLKPVDLERWIDREFGDASENGRLGVKRAVFRCFNWAVKKGLIEKNPVQGADIYSKPGSSRPASYQPRRTYLAPEQWELLIATVDPTDWLHDYLMFLRETGCRPQEARILEARHFIRDSRLLLIPKDEAKGKKRDRVIPLNDVALLIIQRLMLKHPAGTLFRSNTDKPISKHTLTTRFSRLSDKLGFHVHAYMLRRTFVTDALANGLTADVLKAVVGHATTAMIDTVYSVLERRPDVLLNAVKQARKGIA